MASGLGIAALVLSAAGASISIADSLEQAEVVSDALEAQAERQRQLGQFARAQAATRAAQQERAAARALGARRSGFGTSGITLAGSPQDVLADAAFEEEVGLAVTRSRGELEATQQFTAAEFAETRAGNIRTQAGVQATAQGLSAAGSLLSMRGGMGGGGGSSLSGGSRLQAGGSRRARATGGPAAPSTSAFGSLA